jgi:branched-subunit amino acid aminotransferase/4-amino-4-deoxychorismate lyase
MAPPDHTSRPPFVYLNGNVIGRDEARVSPFDRGFLYGDGFFETTRIVAGAPLLLDRHLRRLRDSCCAAGFGDGPDTADLAAGVDAVTAANAISEGYLRITVTRGEHTGRLAELRATEPTVFAEARPMDLPPLDRVPPIRLLRSRYSRNEDSPIVRHKSLSYQGNVLALAEARQAGADEVYFLDSHGRLTEGATTNLFLVRQGIACTPEVECALLPGVTREVVLELCRANDIPAETGRYSEDDLLEADEVFCTNGLRGIIPVSALIDHPEVTLSQRTITGRLQDLYAAFVASDSAPLL